MLASAAYFPSNCFCLLPKCQQSCLLDVCMHNSDECSSLRICIQFQGVRTSIFLHLHMQGSICIVLLDEQMDNHHFLCNQGKICTLFVFLLQLNLFPTFISHFANESSYVSFKFNDWLYFSQFYHFRIQCWIFAFFFTSQHLVMLRMSTYFRFNYKYRWLIFFTFFIQIHTSLFFRNRNLFIIFSTTNFYLY